MRQSILAVTAAGMLMAGVDLQAQNGQGGIRAENGTIRELIARVVEGSATFRDLISRLEAGDVVAHVRFSSCGGGVPSCLQWASAVAGVRRVVIRIDPFSGSQHRLTALLAHELQHACEVAEAPGITDLASFVGVFQQRGVKNAAGFETPEAQEVTRKVFRELFQR